MHQPREIPMISITFVETTNMSGSTGMPIHDAEFYKNFKTLLVLDDNVATENK